MLARIMDAGPQLILRVGKVKWWGVSRRLSGLEYGEKCWSIGCVDRFDVISRFQIFLKMILFIL